MKKMGLYMKNKMRLVFITIILILASSMFVQCSTKTGNPSAKNPKLKVVATTNIIADVVSNVGGNLIELTSLLPINSDPHTFEPTPQDAVTISKADVIFINGLGLETFLDDLMKNAGGQAIIVSVSDGVELRTFSDSKHGHDEHGHDGNEGEHANHESGGHDPHTWMTPKNVQVFVDNIEQTLHDVDPTHATIYQANAESYKAQLEKLDVWAKNQVEQIPVEHRKLVSDHQSFGYYADRYGLEIIGAVIPTYSSSAEPSAQELAELQHLIEEFNVKAIFVGATANNVLPQRLADDTGIKIIPLYTGSLGETGSGVETYFDFIRYNTTAIVEALK